MTGVEDMNSVYEVNGHKITRRIRYLSVRFKSFNFTIEFYRSVYLVQPGSKPKSAPKRVKFTLQLDKLDDISAEWINSDILIFDLVFSLSLLKIRLPSNLLFSSSAATRTTTNRRRSSRNGRRSAVATRLQAPPKTSTAGGDGSSYGSVFMAL
ncbi:hypothetical protein RJ640_008954 [Escallonia rubra]|uniref:Trichome birefringence-like C-terminal domain-containing protein n=1 Tax=Escallonia rubra TaxID=112253 RepID=A0AA88RF25_9ASTE|nr:hypothetical protein RJ640_008954 [Escallonia rubra]